MHPLPAPARSRRRRALLLAPLLAAILPVVLFGCGKGGGFAALGVKSGSPVVATTGSVPVTTTSPVTPATYAAGSSPIFVTAADFNRDGKPDPIVANAGDGTVSIFPNQTPGSTPPAVFASRVNVTSGNRPVAIGVGDFNGDGVPDAVVANQNDNNVAVFLNLTGSGVVNPVFSSAALLGVGSAPIAVAVADLNGDGKDDIAVANSGGNSVTVYLNLTANGAVAPVFAAAQTFAVGAAPSAIAIADVNRDGKPDIVVADQGAGKVSILLNTTPASNPAATFLTHADFATGSAPVGVALEDVNGDGVVDVVTANSGDASVSVLVNATSAGSQALSFTPVNQITLVGTPSAVAVVDLNGDGKREVVTTLSSTSQIDVLVSTASGGVVAFGGQATYSSPAAPSSLRVLDVNGDGKPDVLAVSPTAGVMAVELNQTPGGVTTPVLVRNLLPWLEVACRSCP